MKFKNFNDAVLWANQRTDLPADTGQYKRTNIGETHEVQRERKQFTHDLSSFEFIEKSGAVDVIFQYNACTKCNERRNESITITHGQSAFTKFITSHGESMIEPETPEKEQYKDWTSKY